MSGLRKHRHTGGRRLKKTASAAVLDAMSINALADKGNVSSARATNVESSHSSQTSLGENARMIFVVSS